MKTRGLSSEFFSIWMDALPGRLRISNHSHINKLISLIQSSWPNFHKNHFFAGNIFKMTHVVNAIGSATALRTVQNRINPTKYPSPPNLESTLSICWTAAFPVSDDDARATKSPNMRKVMALTPQQHQSPGPTQGMAACRFGLAIRPIFFLDDGSSNRLDTIAAARNIRFNL
jgi:hypothetical protein